MGRQFKELDLSPEFMEHFAGLMLGDGYLSNKNKSKYSCQLILTNKNLSYIYFVSNILSKEGIEHTVKVKDKQGSFPGSGKTSSLYTKFYVTFAELEDKWYAKREDGTHFKIVPHDLKLTPTVLLHWYIGDGYLVHLKGKPIRVQLCTERYTDDEIMFLRDCLERDLNLKSQIDWNRRRLRIPQRYLADFFDVLPACPNTLVDELGYKWA